MNTQTLPRREEMMDAFLRRDPAYEGIFITAVRTTGIFCRTTCTARKPNPENVEFYGSTRDALQAGYRPCRRCRPLRPLGEAPRWLSRSWRRWTPTPHAAGRIRTSGSWAWIPPEYVAGSRPITA